MKAFVDNNSDPEGGFLEAGISFEYSQERFDNAHFLYPMSCGSPVPNNNEQELAETAWLLGYSGSKELVIDHWYAGVIGSYAQVTTGIASEETNDILGINVPIGLRPFMMLENHEVVTERRKEGIVKWLNLLSINGDISRIRFSTGPERGFYLKDLLAGAQENESLLTYVCPVSSIESGRIIRRQVRKCSAAHNGWIISAERDVKPLPFSERIGEILGEYDLYDLQKFLGTSINGKATFRLYAHVLKQKDRSAIMIRDYSNARGTLKQCSENFDNRLIISKRIYADGQPRGSSVEIEKLLSEPPFSRGETVTFCT